MMLVVLVVSVIVAAGVLIAVAWSAEMDEKDRRKYK